MITKLLLIFSILVLAGCATAPESISYADHSAKYEALKTAPMKRVIFEFDAVCYDSGICEVKESRLQDAADTITALNDAVDSLVTASNTRLDAISHCEYAGIQKDQAIRYMEQSASRAELTGTVKQVITALTCGALIWMK
jgi:uncharacterized lipoprotein YajG